MDRYRKDGHRMKDIERKKAMEKMWKKRFNTGRGSKERQWEETSFHDKKKTRGRINERTSLDLGEKSKTCSQDMYQSLRPITQNTGGEGKTRTRKSLNGP